MDIPTELLTWFEHCGYIRRCDPDRRKNEGQAYKKGYEVRFVLQSEKSLHELRRLLTAAGLQPGKPFRKHRKIVQPVYGREIVDSFVSHLPVGRNRTRLGFGREGQRLIRRVPEGS